MANGFNRVQLIGNLGDEPVVRNTQSGSCVTNITLAINETRRDQATGNTVNETEWVRVVAFGRTAEIMRDYLHKGTQVHIEGKIRTRSYEDKNTGEKKYSTEVVCEPNGLLMLGGRNQDMGGSNSFGGNNDHQSGNSSGNYQNPRSQGYGNGGNSSSYQNRSSHNGAFNRQGANQQQRYSNGTGAYVSSGTASNSFGQAQPQSEQFNQNGNFNQNSSQSSYKSPSQNFNQAAPQSFNRAPAQQSFNQAPATPITSNPDTAPSAVLSDDIPF